MSDVGQGLAAEGAAWFGFELCKGLVDAGAFTREQAAGVMVATADKIRTSREESQAAQAAEMIARVWEQMGGWLLGKPDPLL